MGNRIYYAVQQVGIAPNTGTNFTAVHGLQNLSLGGFINLIPIPTLGSLSPYAVVEDNDDVQVSLRKILDGYPTLFSLASDGESQLDIALTKKSKIALSIFDDSLTSATGEPCNILQCGNMRMSSLRYTFDNQSPFMEELSFAGDERLWKTDVKIVNPNAQVMADSIVFNGAFNGVDNPLSGISQRSSFLKSTSRLPTGIVGIATDGTCTGCHIHNISISLNTNRSSIPSLGQRGIYASTLNFPSEVISEITVNPVTEVNSGDLVSFIPSGILSDGEPCNNQGNVITEYIYIDTCGGPTINLGSGNRLVSVSYQGVDTRSNFAQVAYTYRTYNLDECSII